MFRELLPADWRSIMLHTKTGLKCLVENVIFKQVLFLSKVRSCIAMTLSITLARKGRLRIGL